MDKKYFTDNVKEIFEEELDRFSSSEQNSME